MFGSLRPRVLSCIYKVEGYTIRSTSLCIRPSRWLFVPMTMNKGVRVLNLILTAARRGICRSLESSRVEDGELYNGEDKIQCFLCHSAALEKPFLKTMDYI